MTSIFCDAKKKKHKKMKKFLSKHAFTIALVAAVLVLLYCCYNCNTTKEGFGQEQPPDVVNPLSPENSEAPVTSEQETEAEDEARPMATARARARARPRTMARAMATARARARPRTRATPCTTLLSHAEPF